MQKSIPIERLSLRVVSSVRLGAQIGRRSGLCYLKAPRVTVKIDFCFTARIVGLFAFLFKKLIFVQTIAIDMKKILFIALTAMLAFSACDKKTQPEPKPEPTADQKAMKIMETQRYWLYIELSTTDYIKQSDGTEEVKMRETSWFYKPGVDAKKEWEFFDGKRTRPGGGTADYRIKNGGYSEGQIIENNPGLPTVVSADSIVMIATYNPREGHVVIQREKLIPNK